MIADFHIHSSKSFDADKNATISRIYRYSASRKLRQIALCDHFDINWIASGENPNIDFSDSRRQIDEVIKEYHADTEFLLGIELGQPNQFPDFAEYILKSNDFDFVLGSLHNARDEQDFYYIDVKNMSRQRITGLWEKYLAELTELASFDGIHAVAHITYPFRYFQNHGIYIDTRDYTDAFTALFKRIIQRGVALEVNTSGLRKRSRAVSPDFGLLKLYRECGGELVVLGSDAHCVPDIGSGINFTERKLVSLGFKYICGIKDKKLYPIKINY